MSNSQSESALKERVRQMDHSPQLDTMTHTQLQGCMFVLCCSCMYHEDNIVGFSCDFMLWCERLHSWKIWVNSQPVPLCLSVLQKFTLTVKPKIDYVSSLCSVWLYELKLSKNCDWMFLVYQISFSFQSVSQISVFRSDYNPNTTISQFYTGRFRTRRLITETSTI